MRNLLVAFLVIFGVAHAAETMQGYPVKDFSSLIGMQGFNNNLLQIHFKLYEGYVKNTNDLLSKLKNTETGSYEYGALKRRLGWEFDGMRLHELYFSNLGGNGMPDKQSALYLALVNQFGGYEQWKKDFIATGSIRGIGWAILYYDPMEKKLINTWINEHDLGHLATGSPILIMDVFEHAYMPQYGLDKPGYITAFFNNINWVVVSDRYRKCSEILLSGSTEKQVR